MRTEARRGRKFIEYIDDSLPAGTFVQEISGADVSYRDETGKWKPISTRFLGSKSGDFAFAADKLNHKIEVGAGGERRWYPRREVTDEYLTLGKPEYYNPKNDKWQPLNVTGSSVNGNDNDTFELDTNQDLTVLMHCRWNGLKVDYVLGSDKAPTRFRFAVGIIGLEYRDDKLYGKDGELVGILTPTIARDANDKEVSAFGKYDGEYLEFGVEAADDAAYPITLDPDFSGSTADGYISGLNATYSTARSTSYSYNNSNIYFIVGQRFNSPDYTVSRSFLKFDTSSILDSSIVSQVNLSLSVNSDYSDTDFDVQIVKQDWSGQDPLSDTNRETAYDNCLSGAADDNIWRNTNGISTSTQYISGNLNTSWINKTGSTYYSLRSSRDKNANEPTGNERVFIWSQNETTASYRPVLVVVYSTSQDYTLTCEAGSYSLTGTAATLMVQRNYVLSCATGSYNLTGTNADLTVQRNYSLVCEAGSYALTGTNVGLFKGLILSCEAGSYILNGTDADLIIQRNYTLVCEAGNYLLTGSISELVVQHNYTLVCEAGTYLITGTDANLVIQRNYTLNCETGSYVLTGTDCTLIATMAPKNYTLVCEAGSYALTGTDINFIIAKNYTLVCEAGAYALTGTDADLTVQRNYTLVCGAGDYALTGTDANFILQRNYTLECGAGSYSLTGTDVNFVIARNYTLTCEVGSYALSGTDANLTVQRNYILVCEAGSYVLTGTDADLVVQRNYTLLCGAGNYTLTGTDATFVLQRNYTLVCEDGSYFLTGTDAELIVQRNYILACEAGSYVLTGADVGITLHYIFALDAGSYILIGTDIGMFVLSGTPECRIHTIEHENRMYDIKHETRTHTIEHENRTLEVKC